MGSVLEIAHLPEPEAGAEEIWFCSRSGNLTFFLKEAPDQATNSVMVLEMPRHIPTY